MLYPYPPIPKDKNLNALPEYPANILSKSRNILENGTTSSVYTVTQDTTLIEVATQGTTAILRWVPVGDTEGSVVGIAGASANYDHAVPPNSYRKFAIPIESQGAAQGSVQGANRLNGLYRRVAIKTQGIASVLLSEF